MKKKLIFFLIAFSIISAYVGYSIGYAVRPYRIENRFTSMTKEALDLAINASSELKHCQTRLKDKGIDEN